MLVYDKLNILKRYIVIEKSAIYNLYESILLIMRILIYVIFLYALPSCISNRNQAPTEIIKYYKGFQNADYNEIKATIADSITITEGKYVMGFTSESYYGQFAWNSVFNPTYDVVDVSLKDQHWLATVSVRSSRFEFLKNNPLKTTQRFYLDNGKISKIENVDFINVDWNSWQIQKESLVQWIRENHPELDRFIEDLSKDGGLKYKKAITLYNDSLNQGL